MASPISNDSFLQWDAAQVSTYINSILPHEQRRIGNVFLDNNVDGSLLPFITTEHLKEIGIISLKTRLVIKKESVILLQHIILNIHQNHTMTQITN